jgi:hypothetical protein
MKHLPAIFFAAIAFSSTASAGDAVTLTWKKGASDADNARTATLTLAAGESVKALWGARKTTNSGPTLRNHSDVILSVTKEGAAEQAALFDMVGVGYSTIPFHVAGPAVIQLADPGDTSVGVIMATLEVTRPASPSVTPSNAAVIPEDASGTFSVILESSTDLITWTAANPGDYAGNTVKRFFRTRIVKK